MFNKFRNVIVIGNGFDINLGLPTKYEDFLISQEFNSLIVTNNKLAKFLKANSQEEKWVDIEKKLSEYSKKIDLGYEDNFEEDYKGVYQALQKYLQKIDYSMINKDSDAYKIIEFFSKEEFLIIDFNYTESTQIILEATLGEYVENRHIKVHGSVKSGTVVFGVEDSAFINANHIFIKKAYSPLFKGVNVNELLKSGDNIIFFGYSLGQTDHTYFNDFFTSISVGSDQKNIFLYYYGKNGRHEIFKEIDFLTHNNLTKLRIKNKWFEINLKPGFY